MSLFTRIRNAFSSERLHRELDQEMRQHIAEAVARGRTEQEARRAFGNLLLTRERSYDAKVLGWLEAVVADAKFGARQLRKNWVVSSAAILSLALAIGSSTAAFRLIDAILLRPLPVADPGRLHYVAFTYYNHAGVASEGQAFSYPMYRDMRAAVGADADLLVVGYSGRVDLTYGGDADMEKTYRQYVSGNLFPVFGLSPVLGRLLSPADDVKPGGHPVAVVSYDYWTSRFGRDPKIIGKTFRLEDVLYQIVGVTPQGFTGTEAGVITGIFVPATMNTRPINQAGWSWFRLWVRPRAGLAMNAVMDRLQAVFIAERRERAKRFGSAAPPKMVDQFLNTRLEFHSAATGVSDTRRQYGRALVILGVLVGLVLLIACVNVANLLSAQAAARSREMALRVSIGAGRGRLVQLVLVESALLALAATVLGGLFAWWAAPWVVSRVSPPDDPMQLALPADWRVLGFSAAIAMVVTLLFGLVPALRASSVKPAAALKGADDSGARFRTIHALVAAQIAFCFLVHFAATLFVSTFQRLSSQPLGFDADRVLLLETMVKQRHDQPAGVWQQLASGLGSTPGVESVALCGWPLMQGSGWDSAVRIPGKPVDAFEPYFLSVSPGFISTMRIPLLAGRDFRPADAANPGSSTAQSAAIVTESFARRYFDGQNPVGRYFEQIDAPNHAVRREIVGLIRDVRYRDLREPTGPVVFVPADVFNWATFAVRTSADPQSLAPALRATVSRLRPDFYVTNTFSQRRLVDQWSIRERLLATLSLFFAGVALLLAAIGLYGVLNYSVVRRTHEIGIRTALGAPVRHLVGTVVGPIFAVFAVGALSGLAAGLASQRLLTSLLYQVKVTDPSVAATPFVLLLAAALLAAVPPVLMAVRIDPVEALRSQ